MDPPVFASAFSLLAALVISAGYPENPPRPAVGYAVELHCAKSSALTAETAAALYSKAVEFVASSEYTSDNPQWNFPQSEIQGEYLRTLGGDYLRVSLSRPLQIMTRGGNISALQILARLSPRATAPTYPDRFVDSLFTIDGNGKVVGYALYSGFAEFRLFDAVADIPGNSCRIPPRVVIRDVLGRDRVPAGH